VTNINKKIVSLLKRKKIKIEYDHSYETFDKIIMATHPDQTLRLIKDLRSGSISSAFG